MVDYHFEVEEEVTKGKLYKFCDGRNYFLHTLKLLHEYVQKYQTSGPHYASYCLNPFKSTLDAHKYVYPNAMFHTITLTLDTGASFV